MAGVLRDAEGTFLYKEQIDLRVQIRRGTRITMDMIDIL